MQKFIGNIPALHVQLLKYLLGTKIIEPENCKDLKKITQFTDIIMKIFRTYRNVWSTSCGW